MSALKHFFDNGNWQSGDDGDWQYVGEIDPQQAAAELQELKDKYEYTQEQWVIDFDVAGKSQSELIQLRAQLDKAKELLHSAQSINDHNVRNPSWRHNSIFAKKIDAWLKQYE